MERPYYAEVTSEASGLAEGSVRWINGLSYITLPGPDPAYAAVVTAAEAVMAATQDTRTGAPLLLPGGLQDAIWALALALAALAPEG